MFIHMCCYALGASLAIPSGTAFASHSRSEDIDQIFKLLNWELMETEE